jgi:hypothetical protein
VAATVRVIAVFLQISLNPILRVSKLMSRGSLVELPRQYRPSFSRLVVDVLAAA